METTTYDLVENSFIYGRSMCAVLNCSSLAALNREHTNYEVISMPGVNATISSKPLSNTWCVCVNPKSQNVDAAEDLAKFMTYENTAGIYSKTGFLSCKRMDYSERGFKDVYQLYDQTDSLPKFIETEELWKDMKQMLNSVAGGTEPNDALTLFLNSLYASMETRTGQEHK